MNNTLASQVSRRSSGFTLLELLVVIGIIGVLAAVTIAQFGGATASAKATTCMTNMRNLAVAVQNSAMANHDGWYPAAGSYKWTDPRGRKLYYPVHKGWISWNMVRENDTSKGGGSSIPFSSGDKEALRLAVTNGAIWRASGASFKSYQCPVHADACYKRNKRYPGWSYVMNQMFGFDSNYGSGPRLNLGGRTLENVGQMYIDGKGWRSGSADRMLLFSEIQGVDIAEQGLRANVDGGGTEGDSVLQYEKNEIIGFNHQVNGKRWIAHVAFADGHVARMFLPRGGLSLTEITKSLCMGHELTFDGSKYEDVSK